jgi:hypothetical protein
MEDMRNAECGMEKGNLKSKIWNIWNLKFRKRGKGYLTAKNAKDAKMKRL